MNAPTFTGTPEQQTLAAEIYGLMVAQGALFAADAPIRQTLSNLSDFFAAQRQRDREMIAQEIDTALRQNEDVFERQEVDGEVVYVTSRQGGPRPKQEDISHTFKDRLYEPDEPLPVDDISVVVSTSRPALTTVEPVFISDYWQQQAGLIPMPPSEDETLVDELADEADVAFRNTALEEAEPVAAEAAPPVGQVPEAPAPAEVAAEEPAHEDEQPAPFEVTPDVPEPVAASAVEPGPSEPVIQPFEPLGETFEEPPVAQEPVVPPPEDEPAVSPAEVEPEADVLEPVPAEAEPAVTTAMTAADSATTLTLPDGTAVDLRVPVSEIMRAHGEALGEALLDHVDQDPLQRIVRFGRTLFTDSDRVNLGKNDLRRIRDYIIEVGEPLLDTAIIADLYYHSQRQSSYDAFRFSLNYRLSREKDFEFVGVENAHLWSTRGLPPIGTKRVKASEMGQLTSYLVEGFDDGLEAQELEAVEASGSLSRFLTFFEWDYGVLPFDAGLATLLPKPLLPDQRSVVLRIESAQHYTSYLVEVRYPTGNRGGWLQGLDEFFHEHLVAGALVTLARTDEPNVFTIAYEEAPGGDDRILTYDEKKNKFAFANVAYECVVDSDQFLSQQKYGKLKNLKALPTSERRKGDVVLRHVVEVVGEQVGTRQDPLYWITLDDLHVAYNVLRPASQSYLQSLLESDESYTPDDSAPGAYYYKPQIDLDGDGEDEAEGAEILTYEDDEEY